MSARFVTIKKFEELTGYTEFAVRGKIARGDWLQDSVWVKAPDGRILLDLDGYERWVVSGPLSPSELQHHVGPPKKAK